MEATRFLQYSVNLCRAYPVVFETELLSFYQRVSIASYASDGIARAEMSVCPSVCPSVRSSISPSHSGIVSKRRKLAS